MEKIKLIKTKDKFLYSFDGYCFVSDYLMNGKEIQRTFNSSWYVIDEYPNLLQKKKTIKINERWELKNKELYNETIPLVVDEHSKEKYKNLVESDLYEHTFEEKEILENVELEVEEIGEIEDDIPFEHKEIINENFGWYSSGEKETYLINEIKFSLEDNCLIPTPIKELTRPCMLPKEYLFQILTDYIKRNIDNNYAEVDSDYQFHFSVCCSNDKKIKLIDWSNDFDRKYTFTNLYAKNFKDLIQKLNNMKKEIIDYVNKDHVCPYCSGTGCTDEKIDVNKWFVRDK